MLSGILNSDRAIAVNIQIMRIFTRLRQAILDNADLRKEFEDLKQISKERFRIVFETLDQLLSVENRPKKKNSVSKSLKCELYFFCSHFKLWHCSLHHYLIISLYSALWPSEALRTILISLQSGNLKVKLPLLSVLPDRINFPLPSKTSIGAFIAFFPFEKKLSVYTLSPSTQAKTCTLCDHADVAHNRQTSKAVPIKSEILLLCCLIFFVFNYKPQITAYGSMPSQVSFLVKAACPKKFLISFIYFNFFDISIESNF